MSPAPGPDSCWGRRPAARSLLVAELLLLKTSRIIYLRCHFVTTKGVNDPSRSFIVPGEGPFWGLSRIESAYTRHVNVKCRYEIRTAKNITDGWYGYERSFKANKAFTTRAFSRH